MIKRIIPAMLALFILVTLLPAQSLAAGGYAIGVTASKSVSEGSDVAVTLDLSQSQADRYHAFDVLLSYDTARLAYKSCSLPAGQVTQTNGTIRLMGYGEEKSKSAALAVITFAAKAEGTATIQVNSAKIDRRNNAITNNAPQAACSPKSVTIRVVPTYTVTLDERNGLSADSMEATRGQPYTFKAADHENFDYTITAKVGGSIVTVTDNKDGTYTIPGALVTGNITVEAERKGRSYSVSFSGQDVTGEKTASYNTDYTFQLSRKSGYDYSVNVTIGGKAYSRYTLEGNVYTIPGTDITGNIAVTVTKTQKTTSSGTTSGSTTNSTTTNKTNGTVTLKVDFAGSGNQDASGNKTATKGKDYTFRLTKEDGYRYTLSVQIDGKNVEYSYDETKDLYTVSGSMVTGNITVVVNKTVDVEITEYITLDNQSIYLLLVRGKPKNGLVPKYDGQTMYRSEIYPGDTWLVQSPESEATVRKQAEEKTAIAEGKTEAAADYTGNVDRNGDIDINDAQLVYDMYSAKYRLTEIPAMEFLEADVNGDRRVNILDVEWILNVIHIREQEDTV